MSSEKKLAILFVCMGNICRSPTAEGVFRARADAAGLGHQLQLDSAGTHAYHIGEQPDLRSQEFAMKRGIDLSGQRARKVVADDFGKFDLIIAMDKHNLAMLEKICPAAYQHKLSLMMSYATHSDADEVPDPYYGGARGFDQVLDYIEDASDGLIEVLKIGRHVQ
ncbi:low molecular weight protein-tyrosine-phosphatase [Undibacterium sp. RuTC16W]|uniref:low molecular weight protein-tyrosine-phosphatase n=1 Tax=Undibacterium sp. RuTC16W TaxID=3413048 RepID=UPI003BF42DCA